MNAAIAAAAAVRLAVFDVDGVLTDGRLHYGADGGEYKSFHVRDGLGIKLLRRAGIQVGIITARDSPIVARRAAELGIDHLLQGREDKLVALRELVASAFRPGTATSAPSPTWGRPARPARHPRRRLRHDRGRRRRGGGRPGALAGQSAGALARCAKPPSSSSAPKAGRTCWKCRGEEFVVDDRGNGGGARLRPLLGSTPGPVRRTRTAPWRPAADRRQLHACHPDPQIRRPGPAQLSLDHRPQRILRTPRRGAHDRAPAPRQRRSRAAPGT